MLSVADSEYRCTLDSSALEKARKELGENPDTRILEVKQLRKRLEKVPGLKARTDINFLLAFLRVRKFDQERTFELIRKHYTEKQSRSDHYADIKPSVVKHCLDDGLIEVVKERDSENCQVVIIRPGRWDPDRYPVSQIVKLLYLTLSKLSQEEVNQVHGLHIIDVLDSLSMKQALHMTPSTAKLLASTLQDMVPLRLKRYDIVYEPTFFDAIFPIFKSFMKDKLVQRIHLNGTNLKTVHEFISPDHLPTDLGGKLELLSYNEEWFSMLMAPECERGFEYDNKFGLVSMTVENSKKEKKKEDAGLQGLGGTFKKLDI